MIGRWRRKRSRRATSCAFNPRSRPGRGADMRYHRQMLIPWWDQTQVARTRILVVGAGALGNEILKSLALVGAGYTLVFDPDRIERSNLSRSVLFRESD